MTIKVTGFSHSYDKERQVLADLSFEVLPGQIIGVMGANGAGKSTLISAIADYQHNPAITVTSPDESLNPLVTAYDEPQLYSYLSGRHFIRYILDLKRPGLAFPDSLVSGFQLKAQLDELIRGYSFGMKRKVYLATCLAEPSSSLQMDEPTNGLDALSVIFLKDTLRQLAADGKAILLASHDMGFLEAICTSVLILKEGRIAGVYDACDGGGLEKVYIDLMRG